MGGTLLGGAVGLATGTGFAGASIGAKLGSAVGGGIGSFQGGEFNSEMAMGSLTDAISGFSDYSALQVENNLSAGMKSFTENNGFKGMSSTDLQKVYMSIQGMNATDRAGYLQDYWEQNPTVLPNYQHDEPTILPDGRWNNFRMNS